MQQDNDDQPDDTAASADQAQSEQDDAVQQIDFDLNCVRCGYNLRSTLSTGTCPECGEPVETTLRPDLLHMANPTWLGKLRKGMSWLVIAIIMNLLMIPVAMVVGFVSVASSRGGTIPTGMMTMLSVLGLIIIAVYAVGIWFVTSLEPEKINHPITVSLARWLIIPGMALSMLGEVFTNSADPTTTNIGAGISLLGSMMQLVGLLAGLLYLRTLAERIPEPSLAKQTQTVFWGYLATSSAFILISAVMFLITLASSSPSSLASSMSVVGLLMIPVALAYLVFIIWFIVLMFRYRTRFTQAHHIALSQSDADTNLHAISLNQHHAR